MRESEIFRYRSRFEAPVEELFAWHARSGALERLVPPWDNLEVVERRGGIEKGATVRLAMRAGLLPYSWQALHTDYRKNRFFQDAQVKGPFKHWVHNHIFEPDGEHASFLEDRIEYELPAGFLGKALLTRAVRLNLERTFRYRHLTLAADLKTHALNPERKKFTILVSGASGLLGRALVPFLTTGGHRVVRLVRRKPVGADELFWNPAQGLINTTGLGAVDYVIHLAGENIGQGRWTAAKRKRIVESRIKGTSLLAEVVAGLNPKPKAFLSASAIGYYGHRGEILLAEDEACGDDFISGVCQAWETAAGPAGQQGIRTVFLRIGVALTPRGGALARMLPLFRAGLGGRLGTGSQYLSWIGLDDVLGAIHHAMITPELAGPVNLVAPSPVTNQEFTRTLGRLLKRPVIFPAPAAVVRLIFGQMGQEVVLASTRVVPRKLLDTGYRFRNPELAGTLGHCLGIG